MVQKHLGLALVAVHCFIGMIIAVAVVPAFAIWAKEFNVPIVDASYLGSTQVRDYLPA